MTEADGRLLITRSMPTVNLQAEFERLGGYEYETRIQDRAQWAGLHGRRNTICRCRQLSGGQARRAPRSAACCWKSRIC